MPPRPSSGGRGPGFAARRRELALAALERRVVACRRCPRLVAWRERTAREKRRAFADQTYWGRPVPGFGDADAWLLVVGLAPAAHGANRTGRMFTGDRSGEWLFRALHRAGLANRPDSVARRDGLELRGTFVTAVMRCAPPQNRPLPEERDRCRPYLERELDLLTGVRVIVALGGYAYAQVSRLLRDRQAGVPSPMPRFGHGVEVGLGGGRSLLASYHPSQQNTFTGKLTEEMFDAVWRRAVQLGAAPGRAVSPRGGRS